MHTTLRIGLALTAAALLGCNGNATSDAGIDAGADDASVMDAGSDLSVDMGPPDLGYLPLDRPAIDAENGYAMDDPHYLGELRFLWDAWGTEVLGSWPPADFMVGLQTSEPAVFGNQFSQFGFIRDPGDDLPIGLKRGLEDATQIHETCALCHVGQLPDGHLWLGAPNLALDFERFRVAVSDRWVAAGNPPLMTDLERTKALQLGPGRESAESGDYPQVVPADFPVYFDLGAHTSMNYLGTGGNVRTEAFLSIFTFGAGSMDSTGAIPVPFPVAGRVDPFVSFLGSLHAPPGPPQDPTTVARGMAVFTSAHCDSCHHPDDVARDGVTTIVRAPTTEVLPGDATYPSGSIATDPLHRILQDGDPDGGMGGGIDMTRIVEYLAFITRNHLTVHMTDGYRVNNLHGTWYSAPYLHNGSVPTLEDLLNPAAMRPTTFMRGTFTVDTTVPGNGNMGHEFGTTLSAADKTALLAYLRSL